MATARGVMGRRVGPASAGKVAGSAVSGCVKGPF